MTWHSLADGYWVGFLIGQTCGRQLDQSMVDKWHLSIEWESATWPSHGQPRGTQSSVNDWYVLKKKNWGACIKPTILNILYGIMRIKEERGQRLAFWAKRLAIWTRYDPAKGACTQERGLKHEFNQFMVKKWVFNHFLSFIAN